jgi:high-affinity Fe2+/Pb2+ permease
MDKEKVIEMLLGEIKTANEANISLRDYFAAHALQGMPARDEMGRSTFTECKSEEMAKWAYLLADAMLVAREQEDGQDTGRV